MAFNVMTQQRDKPNLRDWWAFLSGFSCKSVSGINANAEEDALGKLDCQTGSTFGGVRRILEKSQVAFAILENVLGLESHGQAAAVHRLLAKSGYFTRRFRTCPTRTGLFAQISIFFKV